MRDLLDQFSCSAGAKLQERSERGHLSKALLSAFLALKVTLKVKTMRQR